MAEEDTAKEKVSLLPEFYVDLICRITPGIIFLPIWAAIIAKDHFNLIKDLLATVDKSYAFIFLLFIALSYVVGFMADIVADFIEPLFIWISHCRINQNKSDEGNNETFVLIRPELSILNNELNDARKTIEKFKKWAELISIIIHFKKSDIDLLLSKLIELMNKSDESAYNLISSYKDLNPQQKDFLSKLREDFENNEFNETVKLAYEVLQLNKKDHQELLMQKLTEFEYTEFGRTKTFKKISLIINRIDKLKSPQKEMLMKKMLAEATLFKCMSVLYIVTIVLFLFFTVQTPVALLLSFIFSLIGLIPFVTFAIDRNIKVQERLDNF